MCVCVCVCVCERERQRESVYVCGVVAEWLRQCLAETMSLRKAPQLLDEVSFEGVARYIAEGKCSRIVTMAGAGISTCK